MAASRELVVVVLNLTNEELSLFPESPNLSHGKWMDDPGSRPPQEIRAGESGMWRCQAEHIGVQIEGSASYSIVGYDYNVRVTFTWKIYSVRPNEFNQSCAAEGFEIQVIGGGGRQPVVVYVFKPTEPVNS
ncbi:hypothetical protein B0J13DRAFT_607215 [Dactylonectria estremocensis]|uniref:Uncharacterized protein n=1 Tax=Dactylonectria estremocensis TaxID=1079267 RepID=A0A9P9ERB2_9HYPO|nr:hypothetical protein B0J13DRAFT_607215 [Dactylonectria estremocensis]